MINQAAILVVEDVKTTRYALVNMLIKQGFSRIHEAEDGARALELLKTHRIDLVLLDVMMPALDGHEVLRTMKADRRLRHIPVIMVTALDDMDSAVKCIELGAEDYLIKPPNPVMMRARIFASLEKKRLRDIEKEYLRMYDPVTGLPNRRFFVERLSEQIHRNTRPQSLFAVLTVRIGKYHMIFESLGHQAGERYLTERSDQLKRILPEDALLARTGDHSFAILLFDLPYASRGDAVALRIFETLSQPLFLERHEITGRVSVGVVHHHRDYENAEDMLRDADMAARRASPQGGFKLFDDTMHQEAMRRLELEPELMRALSQQEMTMHYQPIVALDDEGIVGYEALLRWRHPKKGIILPGEFIRIAEETGMIVPIGTWVLFEVCRQAAEWEKQLGNGNPFSLSINVSAHQFMEPEFLPTLQDALEKTGAKGEYINLELTETAIIENVDRVAEVLAEARRIQIKTSLDDFGKGYCSLNYLNRLPFDTLKIDQSFIHRIHRFPRNRAIVGSTIELAHQLGMNVVAEGIETADEAATLRELTCEYGQGWFYREPMPCGKAGQLLC